MKTIHQMLRELARADVAEFAVASDRLPCVKVGDRYEPIDDVAPTTASILEMLVTTGGSRYVDDLEAKPAQWTTRIEGLGSVAVHALLRNGRAQARFTVVRAAGRTVARLRTSRPPARKSARPPAVSGGLPGAPDTALASETSRAPSKIPPPRAPSKPPTAEGLEGPSDPLLLRGAVVQAPVARAGGRPTLDELFVAAREAGASDLHVIAGRPMMLRLAGELVPRGTSLDATYVDAMLVPIVPQRLRVTLAEQGSADFAMESARSGRFRVNVSRQRTGLKGCFRCIAPGVPTLASLGLPSQIARATRHHQGLVVITGPTGHGKTSTLAAIVDILNRETTHHVITVEDPVEYLHPRKKAVISQREVGSNTLSFASALKASLREDPDVIVVGELRDTETVRMALAASETGHLVLGTMNTPSAAKTIDRLVDLFPTSDQAQVRTTLAGGLHLIVSQRLLPAADGRGMAAAVELLPGSIALWSLIRDSKTFQIPSLQQRGKGFGILRLDESLADLVREGRVTQAAAMAVAESPDELEAVLAGKRAPALPAEPSKDGLLGKAGQLFGKRGA